MPFVNSVKNNFPLTCPKSLVYIYDKISRGRGGGHTENIKAIILL